jgi:glyoxylase-like metal-dependent hydrolase (beta-lactamase superfamily II)
MQAPDSFDPVIGTAEPLAADLRRIVAPNPSPMTYRGTNTYLLGRHGLAVIDPGPDHPDHLQAILQAVGPGQQITHILVTHTHLDHSPLARPLAEATGAPVLAFGTAESGRSEVMKELGRSGLIGGGEGIDAAFAPDETVADGDRIDGDGWSLQALHTPGHIGNHLCFTHENACFTGDLVMGWASSLVSPPDGDLTDFMTSCRRLAGRRWEVFHPGHGAPVHAPMERLDWLISHRLSREAAILERLATQPASAAALADAIYTETPPALRGAATRNVLAHLVDLYGKSLVAPKGALHVDAVFKVK